MALTRKMLKAMGLTDEQVDSIIENHTETVNALNADITKYKKEAEDAQKDLRDLKAEGDGGYKKKYEDEHTAFENYKTAQSRKETRKAKETAFRALCKNAGMSEKYIDHVVRVTDIDALEMDGDKLKNESTHTESVKKDWAEFITVQSENGADTGNPPANNNHGDKDLGELSMEDYIAERKKK